MGTIISWQAKEAGEYLSIVVDWWDDNLLPHKSTFRFELSTNGNVPRSLDLWAENNRVYSDTGLRQSHAPNLDAEPKLVLSPLYLRSLQEVMDTFQLSCLAGSEKTRNPGRTYEEGFRDAMNWMLNRNFPLNLKHSYLTVERDG